MIKKQVIIINGSAGAGKDTFVNIVKKYLPAINYSSVDEIKEIMHKIGWNGQKDEASRQLICDLKKMFTAYNDYPFECLKKKYLEFQKDSTYVLLFFHIREPLEISRAVAEFNAKTLFISRDVELYFKNTSDQSVKDYVYDMTIHNNKSIDKLELKVKEFLKNLGYNILY